MNITVRPMEESEIHLIIDYFHSASAEHLEMMGIDPTRLPAPTVWEARYRDLHKRPMEERENIQLVWLLDNIPVGFSTADKIERGECANMHLHVIEAQNRNRGVGTPCVRRSVDLYFELLHLKQLFCEPNAFNMAPNRALQAAGFKFLKTYMTVPGPLNYHQAVTRWVVERG